MAGQIAHNIENGNDWYDIDVIEVGIQATAGAAAGAVGVGMIGVEFAGATQMLGRYAATVGLDMGIAGTAKALENAEKQQPMGNGVIQATIIGGVGGLFGLGAVDTLLERGAASGVANAAGVSVANVVKDFTDY